MLFTVDLADPSPAEIFDFIATIALEVLFLAASHFSETVLLMPLILSFTVDLMLDHLSDTVDLMPSDTLDTLDFTLSQDDSMFPFIPSRIGLSKSDIPFHTLLITSLIMLNVSETVTDMLFHASVMIPLQFSQIN